MHTYILNNNKIWTSNPSAGSNNKKTCAERANLYKKGPTKSLSICQNLDVTIRACTSLNVTSLYIII